MELPDSKEAPASNFPTKRALEMETTQENIDGQETEHSTNPSTGIEVSTVTKKKKKPGVVYLSSIPDGMCPNSIVKYFNEGIGNVGRISLHEKKGAPRRTIRHNLILRTFCEGWVEFVDKKDAKKCAFLYNGSPVTGKKRSKWRGCIWNIKYLPKFQWQHLKERMEFERATHEQRVREETRLAKREAQYFSRQIELSQSDKRRAARKPEQHRPFQFTQHKTDEQIQKLKKKGERAQAIDNCRKNVIANLFKPANP